MFINHQVFNIKSSNFLQFHFLIHYKTYSKFSNATRILLLCYSPVHPILHPLTENCTSLLAPFWIDNVL